MSKNTIQIEEGEECIEILDMSLVHIMQLAR